MPARRYPKCKFCPHNCEMHSSAPGVGCWLCECQAVSGTREERYEVGWRALEQLETMAKISSRGVAAAEELITTLPRDFIVDYRIYSSVRSGYHSAVDLLHSLSRLRDDGVLAAATFRPTLGIATDHIPRPRHP